MTVCGGMSKREIRKPFVRKRAAAASDGINAFDKDKAELSPPTVYYVEEGLLWAMPPNQAWTRVNFQD